MFQIIVPTPYAVGPVNVYLIKSDPLTLIDAGPNNAKAAKVLEGMLTSLGINVKDIKRVVITHAHPDHSGLASDIARKSGATVLIHPWELKKMDKAADLMMERLPYAIEAGVPQTVIAEMYGERDKLPRPNVDNCKVEELTDDDKIEFAGGQLQVLHLPGHSPGHTCLYDPEQKTFFSGDFLLPHITPNPVIEPDPENPGKRLPTLKQYLNGLKKVDDLKISMVCPGHGGVFNDYRGAVNVARCHHDSQFKIILNKLNGKELSSYELSKEVYPNLHGWDIFLGLSEIQAHLDLLVEWGSVSFSKKNGVNYYHRDPHAAKVAPSDQ
ncbi:MBL fold metallo-hydrolase [Desulfotruncus alcoholivorax]|uniref:MBL fold metallo-hydrolase n=1 Tax=Desulfotruncus alcoholivorax TaxID=265477 RepID=UPI001EE50058|nr:MBL fold metallo-hydrolase [Desulfotruncus alcoholivorax]